MKEGRVVKKKALGSKSRGRRNTGRAPDLEKGGEEGREIARKQERCKGIHSLKKRRNVVRGSRINPLREMGSGSKFRRAM